MICKSMIELFVYCRLVKFGFVYNCVVIKVLFFDGYNYSN